MSSLPLVIAGPVLRHISKHTLTLWLVTSKKAEMSPAVFEHQAEHSLTVTHHHKCIPVGQRAFIHLLEVKFEDGFTAGELYAYDFTFAEQADAQSWQQEKIRVCYPGHSRLNFRWQNRLTHVLHGSCRKPHHPGDDALLQLDELIEAEHRQGPARPDILLMTGDQVYVDDVAGPMLQAIQDVVERLGLYGEALQGAVVEHSSELASHPANYYQRDQILPQIALNTTLSKLFFGAKKKPIFTSINAQNHLIALNEIIAMYLLTWSDILWKDICFDASKVPPEHQQRFQQEQKLIADFAAPLHRIRRALAHIPAYMIFDDHDVTDDWNLTRGWEEEVYRHPLSRRMVGNALIGYWLCQGWGNQPQKFEVIAEQAAGVFSEQGLAGQDDLINTLFDFEDWHYTLQTQPPVYVMDTRTRRWRSESSLNKPSGLMDWEALCEFQQEIIGQDAVIVVSAAPIYGVKMIETVQRVFTFFGKALTVDAENWMAHKGTANVILNIFRHYKTPPEFIILSGDVHYSFVYDVRLRFRRNSPHITQFTCSGLKNSFPADLLSSLERFNRWLYGPESVLNIFTRRRNMSVRARRPHHNSNCTLLNKSAIGQLLLTNTEKPAMCNALCSDGEKVEFPAKDSR